MPMSRYIHLFNEPPKREREWRIVESDIEEALEKNVQRVQQQTSVNQGGRESVYVGNAGVALMQLTLACVEHKPSASGTATDQNPLSPALLASLADRHLTSALHDGTFGLRNIRDGAHISFLDTPIGTACLILSRYPFGKQQSFAGTHWKRCRDYMLKAVETVEQDDAEFGEDDDGCEVLYGRAGFLYALLYLRNVHRSLEKYRETIEDVLKKDLESCKELVSDATIQIIVRSIVRRGLNGAKTYRFEFGGALSPPLMWAWHSKRYLGGAHGVAGILQMLLRCPFPIIEEYMPDIVQTIDWLVTCQDRIGNWPTRAPDLDQTTFGEHELVQWCHGAPAMVILLSTILRMSVTPGITTKLTERQQDRFVISLQRGCALVYMRGLLRKGVGLCHGVAGSVYALLAASDVLDIPDSVDASRTSSPSGPSPPSDNHAPYFTQAVHLAHLATYSSSLTKKGDMKTPDHPWSLYEGMAGMCCAWGEVLYRMRDFERPKSRVCSGMPGYDDIVYIV